MATMAEVSAKIALAVTANEAGDFASALTYLRSAKMLIACLPSRSAKEGEEVELQANAIDSMFAEIRRAHHGAVGLRSSAIVYKNTPPTDDDC
jgi:hypothetical protein